MVEHVENFGPELQAVTLAKVCILENAQLRVERSRTTADRARRISYRSNLHCSRHQIGVIQASRSEVFEAHPLKALGRSLDSLARRIELLERTNQVRFAGSLEIETGKQLIVVLLGNSDGKSRLSVVMPESDSR